MAGEGKDPETRNTKSANTQTRTEGRGGGERRRGKGREPRPPRSQNLFAADFLTIAEQQNKRTCSQVQMSAFQTLMRAYAIIDFM